MTWQNVGSYQINSSWLTWFFTDRFNSEYIKLSHNYNQTILGLKILMVVSDQANNNLITQAQTIYPRQDKSEVIYVPDQPFITNKVLGFFSYYYWDNLQWTITLDEWI